MKITDILGRSWTVDCIGCAIGESEMAPPGGMIAENGTFCVHQDPLVPLEGFVVVASKRHVRSMAELTPDEHADFSSLLRISRDALQVVPGLRSFSLVQEEAASHFHAWFFPWSDSLAQHYGDTSLRHIRPAMAHATQTLNTPEQRVRVLRCVDRLRHAVLSLSQAP